MEKESKNREELSGMLRRWRASGLSQVKFCEQEGVSFHRFYYWYKKLRVVEQTSGSFVRLKPEMPGCGDIRPRTEVYFANGNRIIFRENIPVARLRQLVR